MSGYYLPGSDETVWCDGESSPRCAHCGRTHDTSQPAGYHPPPELTLDLHGHCPRCAEQLAVEGYPVALCPTCDGAGEVAFPSPCYYASGWEYIDVDCPSCSGDCIDPDTGWDSMSAAWCEYLTYLPSA